MISLKNVSQSWLVFASSSCECRNDICFSVVTVPSTCNAWYVRYLTKSAGLSIALGLVLFALPKTQSAGMLIMVTAWMISIAKSWIAQRVVKLPLMMVREECGQEDHLASFGDNQNSLVDIAAPLPDARRLRRNRWCLYKDLGSSRLWEKVANAWDNCREESFWLVSSCALVWIEWKAGYTSAKRPWTHFGISHTLYLC